MKFRISILIILVSIVLFSCAFRKKEVEAPAKPEKELPFEKRLDILSAEIVTALTERGITKITVAEFCDTNGETNQLGVYLSEEMLFRLMENNQIEVVKTDKETSAVNTENNQNSTENDPANETSQTLSVSYQQKINEAITKTDETTINPEIGNLLKDLAVDAVVGGIIDNLGTKINLKIKIISNPDGNVSSLVNLLASKNEIIYILLGEVPKNIE
ncbi:MAG: hypothetical protein PHR06_02250 [Candidatus Cloacimonetes bacterium]|nr:hypothetical protein [Candidatus Cloacimonadota bacterium]